MPAATNLLTDTPGEAAIIIACALTGGLFNGEEQQ
eukprot:COSAG06_NODE_8307_length_2207_cov_4.807400_2_plen_35_part_00